MTQTSDIIHRVEPATVLPVRPANLGIALWFMCLGAVLFSVALAATLILIILSLLDVVSLAERLSGTPLYVFAGSFGMVPGALLFVWGKALIKHGPSGKLSFYLLVFSVPILALCIFLYRFDGLLWTVLALICVIALWLTAMVIWRSAGRIKVRTVT